ncbi:hypothetical protein FRX31_002795, partial [Thalictrum thalictroides]
PKEQRLTKEKKTAFFVLLPKPFTSILHQSIKKPNFRCGNCFRIWWHHKSLAPHYFDVDVTHPHLAMILALQYNLGWWPWTGQRRSTSFKLYRIIIYRDGVSEGQFRKDTIDVFFC